MLDPKNLLVRKSGSEKCTRNLQTMIFEYKTSKIGKSKKQKLPQNFAKRWHRPGVSPKILIFLKRKHPRRTVNMFPRSWWYQLSKASLIFATEQILESNFSKKEGAVQFIEFFGDCKCMYIYLYIHILS